MAWKGRVTQVISEPNQTDATVQVEFFDAETGAAYGKVWSFNQAESLTEQNLTALIKKEINEYAALKSAVEVLKAAMLNKDVSK